MTKRAHTDEPITIALKPLMRERRLTFRALATLTQAHDADGRGVTYAYLCGVTSGREYPSRRSIELIAASLDLEPDHFAEYRLAELRREFNGRESRLRGGLAALLSTRLTGSSRPANPPQSETSDTSKPSPRSEFSVDVAAMRNSQHENHELGVLDRIHHPVVADPDAPQARVADERSSAWWPRLFHQGVDRADDTSCDLPV